MSLRLPIIGGTWLHHGKGCEYMAGYPYLLEVYMAILRDEEGISTSDRVVHRVEPGFQDPHLVRGRHQPSALFGSLLRLYQAQVSRKSFADELM